MCSAKHQNSPISRWQKDRHVELFYRSKGLGYLFTGDSLDRQIYRMDEIEWRWTKSKILKKRAYQCSYCMQWIKGSPPIKYPSKIVRCEVIALFVEQR